MKPDHMLSGGVSLTTLIAKIQSQVQKDPFLTT